MCPELQLTIDDMICTIVLVTCGYLNIVETKGEGFLVPGAITIRPLLPRALGDFNPIDPKVSV